ncbi:MAG TPA: glycosyltransferase family 87 protein [Xanthobacteraceae bacterium]|jgi:hypothetical protein
MAPDPASSDWPKIQLGSRVELTCFALCVAQAVYLLASLMQGNWVLDADGLIATDFVNIWSAGHQILVGDDPAAVYDVQLHKNAEAVALGHEFPGEYPWLYPPTFLLIASLLAFLPFISAYAVWVALTFAGYVASVRAIIQQRAGILLACAYPGILSNLIVGQTGFLSAALFGGSLLMLQRRPVLAGCLIGLLSFKPHLGILFPLVLLAGRHWRAMAAAVATTVLFVLASCAAVGMQAWSAFFQALPVASRTALVEGRADWGKLQSVFAVTRLLGGSEVLGWTLQLALALAVAIVLYRLWRGRVSFDLKAAALAVGALLVTPYLFLYDLVLLAIAMAFLIRAAVASGDARPDAWGIGCASLLVLVFPFLKAPVGLAAVLLIACLVLRRAVEMRSMPALRQA